MSEYDRRAIMQDLFSKLDRKCQYFDRYDSTMIDFSFSSKGYATSDTMRAISSSTFLYPLINAPKDPHSPR